MSGKRALQFNGSADLRATDGSAGTLLLDPTDVTISTAPSTITADKAQSNISVNDIQAALQTANVVIDHLHRPRLGRPRHRRGSPPASPPYLFTSTYNLTLQADRDLIVNSSIGLGGATGPSNSALTLLAGRHLLLNNPTGTEYIQADGTLTLAAGQAGNGHGRRAVGYRRAR